MQTLILNHYPPVIKQIKEMQQIAKAEDIEFSKLNVSINEVIRNMFVFTADETGVIRFEKLLGIKPKAAQSLDDRKIYIISMMNRRKMGLSEIEAMLSDYCKGIKLVGDICNMEMIVEMGTDASNMGAISDLLEEILPLNIYIRYSFRSERANMRKDALQTIGNRLRIKPLLPDNIAAKTRSVIQADLRARNSLKVKTYTESEIRANLEAQASTGVHLRSKQTMKIKKER